ncbi:type I-E CRISPR-associated protein Cse1/CasA [Streptomyces sp. NPDC002851]
MPSGTYSLLDERWIPVRWTDEAHHASTTPLPARVGLRELLLRSHEIASLDIANPPAHAALLRILYAVTARVTELDESVPGDWGTRRETVLARDCLPEGGIKSYFDRYGERFFLYDPAGGRPWMQDPRLAEQCDTGNTAGVNKLIMTRPSGNNHAWFGHGSDTAPDLPAVPEAILNLLVWHYYGPPGQCSARKVNGVKSSNTKAGPLRSALSYHPEGDTLFVTLLAGLVPPEATVRREEDLCPWEWEQLPDPDAAPPVPKGPCSQLTACSQHALLLVPDEENPRLVRDAFITWAYRNGRIPRADDFLIWQFKQDSEPSARPVESHRALWRDLDALLLREPSGTVQLRRPRVFFHAVEVSEYLRVRSLGFDQERAQVKDTQFVDGTTPPILEFAEERAPRTAPAVGRMRQLGETYGRRLEQAVRKAWVEYLQDSKAEGDAWAAEAAIHYWPAAEAEFWSRFGGLDPTGTALDAGFDPAATRSAFLRLALKAYDAVTGPVTGTQRGAKAVSQARIELYGGPRRTKQKQPA